MKAFIRSAACISPQETFGDEFLTRITGYEGARLKAIEPDYKEFIDPKQARRMSHVIKMGIAAAKKCLADGNVEIPGAIITGTAYGCIEDTVNFLTRIVEQQEELLSPTAFIQSTHNTVAAQIALMLQCHNYNLTYVHKGVSFENALTDALMLVNEQEADNVLVGGTDELVDACFKVLTRLGLYKRHPINSLDLFKERSKGTIGGEGAIFFLLNSQPSPRDLAELSGLKVLYKPTDIHKSIEDFLSENEVGLDEIDLLITGKNGDSKSDEIYAALGDSLFPNTPVANYKHLCGEYPVSTSFALWLAANILKKQTIPEVIMEKGSVSNPRKILIHNHYLQKYHSLMLVSAV